MGKIIAAQRPVLATSDVRNCAVSFADQLDTGETLTGTPTVVEIATTDLTITNKAVSTAVLTINGASVAIAEAVQFTVSGQLTTHTPYKIKITATTTSTPAQTLVRYVMFDVSDT